VLGFCQQLEALQAQGALPGVLEWLPSFAAVSVYFDPARHDPDALATRLAELARTSGAARVQGRSWALPVCFDPEFAPDLADLAQARGLSPAQVLALMGSTTFTVYMLGFLPGFPYLGGLPAECQMPRLATPRSVVPTRSLAVAGGMCAVYPWASPGGWRLLGRTPLPLFDLRRGNTPALLAPGDRVRWVAVERAEYQALEAAAEAGTLDLARFLTAEVQA
jgi:KipI family sensor histidine kinase inhibitor